MDKTNALGAALRAARVKAGMNVPDVATAIGRRSHTSVYRWEWGKSRPHYSDLEKLAALYGVTVGQLVDGEAIESIARTAGGRS